MQITVVGPPMRESRSCFGAVISLLIEHHHGRVRNQASCSSYNDQPCVSCVLLIIFVRLYSDLTASCLVPGSYRYTRKPLATAVAGICITARWH